MVSRNIHNIMAMAIQFTSNGITTDAFQLHLYRFPSPNLYRLFFSSTLPFFILWKQVTTHVHLLSYRPIYMYHN